MFAELDDFQCEPDQVGRFEIHPDLVRSAKLGLALALIGFTPIRVEYSTHGDWLDVMGLSPLFVAVERGGLIPVYELKIVRHICDVAADMIEPSINCPAPYVIELHLGED